MSEYKVKSGDTLSEIAQQLRRQGIKVTWQELARANNIDDPRKLRAGASLTIPGQEVANAARSPEPAISQSPLAQKIQADAQRPAPTALGVLGQAGEIAANNPDVANAFSAMGNYATNVLGGLLPALLPAAIRAAPAFNPNAMGTPNLRAAGNVAQPMVRGAVPHAGATPAVGNVRPLANEGASNMVVNALRPQYDEMLRMQNIMGAPKNPYTGPLGSGGNVAERVAAFEAKNPGMGGTNFMANPAVDLIRRGSNMGAGQSRPSPDIATMPGASYTGNPVTLDSLYNIIYGGLR